MILKQKAFQKLAQIMKLKENQKKKKSHIPVSNPNYAKNKNSVSIERNSSLRYLSATLPSISEVL